MQQLVQYKKAQIEEEKQIKKSYNSKRKNQEQQKEIPQRQNVTQNIWEFTKEILDFFPQLESEKVRHFYQQFNGNKQNTANYILNNNERCQTLQQQHISLPIQGTSLLSYRKIKEKQQKIQFQLPEKTLNNSEFEELRDEVNEQLKLKNKLICQADALNQANQYKLAQEYFQEARVIVEKNSSKFTKLA